DRERDNQEINDRVDEVSIRNYRHTGLLDLIKTLISASTEDKKEVLEVEASHYLSDRRHDDIAHKRCHNGSERGADDDANCQIQNIAAHGEFFEFFEHGILRTSEIATDHTPAFENPPRMAQITQIRAHPRHPRLTCMIVAAQARGR